MPVARITSSAALSWSAPTWQPVITFTPAAASWHQVTLYDAAPDIGGQFNIARQIPGKAEFSETLR
jgi:2,4-dienoyl-CoA reductase (NADPH2)